MQNSRKSKDYSQSLQTSAIEFEAQDCETVPPGTGDPLNTVCNAQSTGSTSPDAPPSAPSTGTARQSSVRPKRDFWRAFKEKVNQNKKKIGDVTIEELKIKLRNELDRYQSYDMLDVSECPFSWWAKHKQVFPNISKLALNVLFIPATSVPTERLFSTAGQIITERRNRLLPENAEKLIFLNLNLHKEIEKKKNV